MSPKLLSILGILVAVSCLVAATTRYPGGFDWNRDYISTLLRAPAGPSRTLADIGVLLFSVSLALVFVRLARAAAFARSSKAIRIGGIGSMIYSALTITPMHDLMVTISLVFLLAALVPMVRELTRANERGFFAAGCICLAILGASAAIYYSGRFVVVLPWAQRVSFGLIAVWLVALDFAFAGGVSKNQSRILPN